MSKFNKEQINEYKKLAPGWKVIDDQKIVNKFNFSNFMTAIKFTDKVATEAEKQGHHPKIEIDYNKVKLELFTHTENGLTEKDFLLAQKIDGVSEEYLP